MNYRSTSLFSPLISTATLAVACLLVASLAGQPAGSPLTLLSREARRTVPVALVGDQEFIALDDLAGAFQLAVREEAGAVTVSYRGRTVVLTPNQPLASVSGRLVSLPGPLTRTGNRWLVPVEFINRALAPIYDTRLDLRRQSRLVVIGDLRVPRITVAVDNSAAATRFTFDINPATQNAISQETGRLVIRFEADALDISLPPATVARTRSGGARDRALVHHHRSGPAIRLVPRVDAGDWKHLAIDSRRARRGGRNLESARRSGGAVRAAGIAGTARARSARNRFGPS